MIREEPIAQGLGFESLTAHQIFGHALKYHLVYSASAAYLNPIFAS